VTSPAEDPVSPEVFATFDADHDGFIGADDLVAAFTVMGMSWSRQEVEACIATFDTDGDGLLSVAEFRAVVQHLPTDNQGEAAFMFKALDTDHDGFLSLDEVWNFYVGIGTLVDGQDFNRDRLLGLIADADQDGDGRLSLIEFTTLLSP
jgi:Ca2+-binding EF-hand superfamily protein